ncbi:LysR substrate-binding domain-containing protein [Fibrella sp. ES10-3-2-2]
MKFGEYSAMQQDLDKGVMDLIITSKRGNQPGLRYTPFSNERIVLVNGAKSANGPLQTFLLANQFKAAKTWLKEQVRYSIAAGMDTLKKFWHLSFGRHPEFRPNCIVPTICSIVRCLSGGEGFAIVPDFLCRDEIDAGKVKLVWKGQHVLENTLYFGMRTKTIYVDEIRQMKEIVEKQAA